MCSYLLSLSLSLILFLESRTDAFFNVEGNLPIRIPIQNLGIALVSILSIEAEACFQQGEERRGERKKEEQRRRPVNEIRGEMSGELGRGGGARRSKATRVSGVIGFLGESHPLRGCRRTGGIICGVSTRLRGPIRDTSQSAHGCADSST